MKPQRDNSINAFGADKSLRSAAFPAVQGYMVPILIIGKSSCFCNEGNKVQKDLNHPFTDWRNPGPFAELFMKISEKIF